MLKDYSCAHTLSSEHRQRKKPMKQTKDLPAPPIVFNKRHVENKVRSALEPIPLSRTLPRMYEHVLLMDVASNSGWIHVYRAVTDKERWFYSSTGDIADLCLDFFSHFIPLGHQNSWPTV